MGWRSPCPRKEKSLCDGLAPGLEGSQGPLCLPPGGWFYGFFVFALACGLLFTCECQSLVTAEGIREDTPPPPSSLPEGLWLIHGILGPLGSRWVWEALGTPVPPPSTCGCPALGQGQAWDWPCSWLPHFVLCVLSQRGDAVQLAHLSEPKNRLPPRAVELWAERVLQAVLQAPTARSCLELPLGSHPSCSLPTLLASMSRDQEAGQAPGVPWVPHH